MSVTTRYQKDGTDIGTYFCDLTNDQSVAGKKTFSTTPIVGTMSTSDNSTSAASTAYVKNQAYATLASPTFTGTVTVPAPASDSNTTVAATTAFVISKVPSLTAYAPTASPTFTGTVTVNANIEIYDAANAFIDFKNTASNDYDVRIVCNPTGNLNIWATNINLGSTNAFAPTPAAASDSTNIATTAWVRTKVPDTSTFATKAQITDLQGQINNILNGTTAFTTCKIGVWQFYATGSTTGGGDAYFCTKNSGKTSGSNGVRVTYDGGWYITQTL